jgi:diguanylate cyclase (GGDEF)-like protein
MVDKATRQHSPATAWRFLIVMLVVISATATMPVGAAVQAVSAAVSTAAIAWGVRRNKPADRFAWNLFVASGITSLTGAVLRGLLAAAPGVLGLLPDMVTISSYVLLVCAVLRMLHLRGALTSSTDLADTALIACATWMVIWMVIAAPALAAHDPIITRLLNVVYPAISVLLVFLVGMMAFTQVTSIPAFRFLAAGFAATLTGDAIWAISSVHHLPTLSEAPACYAASAALFAASALHPSMVHLTDPVSKAPMRFAPGRLAGVASSLSLPLVVFIVRPPHGWTSVAMVGSVAIITTGIVTWRMVHAVDRYAETEERLTYQATHDPLTGLPNRALLDSRLTEILTEPQYGDIAVLFLDLDRFKQVNDTWGHKTGDELLVGVSKRLRAAVRASDTVARVSGDEFIIVCPNMRSPETALNAGQRVLGAFLEPFKLSSIEIVSSPSVGVTFSAGRTNVTAEDLIREADTAMYRSKLNGRRDVTLFDDSMAADAAGRLQLEQDLVGAAERGELEMHYQPIVDMVDERPVGFEALMRWHHPTRGAVSPAEFIPVAEETGLIVPIGKWALDVAVAQLAEWHKIDPTMTMSVNVSARQLRDPHLVGAVAATIGRHGVPAERVCLEITETAMVADGERAAEVFAALKVIGVQLSTDDFGTGYSSLAFLRQYPIDQVKIDRSFVAGLGNGIDDEVIIDAVVSIASKLNMHVVAEGVEESAQQNRLAALGCNRGQGWLFGRPMPTCDATKYLQEYGGTDERWLDSAA